MDPETGRSMTGTGTDVRMPRLSESMAEGTIVRWLHASGAAVARGNPLAEIETDKATVTFEADADGVLHILAAEGQTVPVGEVIARVGGASATDTGTSTTPATDPAPADTPRTDGQVLAGNDRGARGSGEGPVTGAPGTAAPGAVSGAEPGPARVRVASSPLARRRARELGVDLTTVTGTGPHGRVVRADIESAASAAVEAVGARGTVAPLSRSRTQRLTAERMVRSNQDIPAFALTVDADVTAALDLRAALAAASDQVSGAVVPTLTDLVVAASGRALRRHPHVNAGITDRVDTPVGYSRVNVGVAVETPAGLVVPVVTDADTRSLGAIAAASRGLVGRARDGRLTPTDVDGATFTVSNLGMFGVREFQAVVIPGQAAILAVGAVRGPLMTLTLSCDHRVLDGAQGARFLRDLVGFLERPHALLLDAVLGKDDA